MANAAHSSKSSDIDHRNRFAELATGLAAMAAAEGVRIVPFRDPGLPYFFAASFSQREHVLKMLELTVQLATDVQRRGEKISDSAPLIWAFCRAWKYLPASDFLDKIEQGDLVDVYNQSGQLIFANLRFFSIAPFSLEELYFRPWHDLFFYRPESYTESMKSICHNILNGPHQIYDLRYLGDRTVGSHSSGEAIGIFQPTFFSSLVQSGKVVGFACINRVIDLSGTSI